ncbi:MAG TPA: flagellar basal body rod protein FlgC [Firmicutes bacterium]|nr:flagellar basal body rod protein FlgC [Bacillota bacterium]HBT17019.1 flagellar basal body rod protein FlgC [Bacillota bacterium]
MRFFRAMDVNGSALGAQRLRLDLISSNIANATTTRTPEGGPYRRKVPVFAEDLKQTLGGSTLNGVRVLAIVEDQTPLRLVYDPSHPDANEEGYVYYPNVNMVNEMVNLMEAGRAYEANVTAFNTAKEMFKAALSIGKS